MGVVRGSYEILPLTLAQLGFAELSE